VPVIAPEAGKSWSQLGKLQKLFSPQPLVLYYPGEYPGPDCLLPIACCLLPVGYWLLAIGYWLFAIAYCLLYVACCLLAIGYWLLAIGYWLLSIVYWLLLRALRSSLVMLL
jgi:hypothetical protein